MRTTKILLVVVFVVSLFIPIQSAHADIAPPSQPSGSNVVPGEVTMVQMMYERVVIDLRSPWSDGIDADVTAKFIMRNQGTVDEQMTVGFPLNSIGDMNFDGSIPKLKDLAVRVDGSMVNVQYTSANDWLINEAQDVLVIDWAVFDVVFPIGKDVTVEINYKQPPTYDAPTTQYDYILITGAGWYGTILEGDIIFRLPYTISYWENYSTSNNENIWGGLVTEAIVENEARWHFENIEPQSYKDNWRVHVIRPREWERILAVREALISNQYDAELWMELGDAYSNAAGKLGGKTCDSSSNAIIAYQQSASLKPDWAEIHARLAWEYYKAYCDSEFQAFAGNQPDEELRQGALQELSVALAQDPNNKNALDLQEELVYRGASWELPAPTPFSTSTLSAVEASTPTETPVVVTVVHTKIVNAPTFTQMPQTTATLVPTEIDIPSGTQKESNSSATIFGALVVFTVGAGSGWLLSKRQKK